MQREFAGPLGGADPILGQAFEAVEPMQCACCRWASYRASYEIRALPFPDPQFEKQSVRRRRLDRRTQQLPAVGIHRRARHVPRDIKRRLAARHQL